VTGTETMCPCGLSASYEECCGRYHAGDLAPTPEALMRSRYAAFVRHEIDYLVATHHPASRDQMDVDAASAWSSQSQWLGLEVVDSAVDGDRGTVEFIARYAVDGRELAHHERSRFARIDGAWFYEDGDGVRPKPVVKDASKVGRNEPCPCGSGKKYKKCCGR